MRVRARMLCSGGNNTAYVCRYLLVDEQSLLLVAPDASGSLSHGVVTQVQLQSQEHGRGAVAAAAAAAVVRVEWKLAGGRGVAAKERRRVAVP